jgi:hypothetical protein
LHQGVITVDFGFLYRDEVAVFEQQRFVKFRGDKLFFEIGVEGDFAEGVEDLLGGDRRIVEFDGEFDDTVDVAEA